MAKKATLVHVTHEAAGKIGGIGAVLQGFFTCNSYLNQIGRSIILGPLFSTEGPAGNRLGENSEVLYSSIDALTDIWYAQAFQEIENFYNVDIVYGRRTFVDNQTGIKSSPEVLLINVTHMDDEPINEFKKQLFEKFGIQSDLYENLWEYEQYVRLAPAAIAALKVIGAADESTVIVAHEFMGMPTALAGIVDTDCDFKTVFYAHEVATMRRIVEEHPGHDTMFYNVIKKAQENKLYVNDVFGNQNSYFKHPLVEASKYCDAICAVGNYIAKELKFLARQFQNTDINIVYNGIPAYKIDIAEKHKSKQKLQLYCKNLLEFKPDFVFTHVTRLVESKGLWRDLEILDTIEKQFRAQDKTGVMFLLSTQASQRAGSDIYKMELEYNWPVAHLQGWPDLTDDEAKFYAKVQRFNAKSRNIKVIFINQFGFEPRFCGRLMPPDMEFMDIRRGSDVEFGLSIYEPFGISHLEPLTFGGICVVSSICGCAGFLQDVITKLRDEGRGMRDEGNIIIADYTNLDDNCDTSFDNLLAVGAPMRKKIERSVSEKIAEQIIQRLTEDKSKIKDRIGAGYSLAKNMSWDVVVKNYVLGSFQKALLNSTSHKCISA